MARSNSAISSFPPKSGNPDGDTKYQEDVVFSGWAPALRIIRLLRLILVGGDIPSLALPIFQFDESPPDD